MGLRRSGSRTLEQAMADSTRDVGREILEGIRQLKRGEHGRIFSGPAGSCEHPVGTSGVANDPVSTDRYATVRQDRPPPAPRADGGGCVE